MVPESLSEDMRIQHIRLVRSACARAHICSFAHIGLRRVRQTHSLVRVFQELCAQTKHEGTLVFLLQLLLGTNETVLFFRYIPHLVHCTLCHTSHRLTLLRVACCVLRVACCVLRVACCVLRVACTIGDMPSAYCSVIRPYKRSPPTRAKRPSPNTACRCASNNTPAFSLFKLNTNATQLILIV
jgi:hypothetical protein